MPYDGTPGKFRVGDALSFGWNKFKANWVTWVVVMAIIGFITFIVEGIFGGGSSYTDSDGTVHYQFTAGSFIAPILVGIVGVLFQNLLTNAALSEVAGVKPSLGTFFRFKNLGPFILAAILVWLAIAVGTVLCIIPGLLALFFFQWAYLFVVDRSQDAVTAIRSSVNAVRTNIGGVLLLMLALFGFGLLSVLTCGIGFLILGPVTAMAWAYAYRVTTGGGPIAA